MPEMKPGRDKIKKFLEENKLSIAELAIAYGVSRTDVSKALNTNSPSPKQNQLILKIISDLGIK